MSQPPGDPRVYFAAERTLLAWVRTGLAVMALGFVVARFALFLSLAAAAAPGAAARPPEGPALQRFSSAVGIGLVLYAAGSILAALYNHRFYVRSLPRQDLPTVPLPQLSSLLALATAVVGLVLAVYLAAA